MNKLFDVNLSPTQFEEEVAKLIRRQGIGLSEFEVKKLEKISVQDGIYEIDITARFEVLGVSFLVLIECKHHKNPIKREVVQILHDRLRAVGGHKGIIFSTARFQHGAIEYAQVHGIALIQIVNKNIDHSGRIDRAAGFPILPRDWDSLYDGQIVSLNEEGNKRQFFVGHPKYLLERFNSSAT